MWLSYQVPEYLGAQGDGEGGEAVMIAVFFSKKSFSTS